MRPAQVHDADATGGASRAVGGYVGPQAAKGPCPLPCPLGLDPIQM